MRAVVRSGLYLAGIVLFLSYLFWRADVIPEAVNPVIGYIDDTLVGILLLVIINKIISIFGLRGGKQKR